VTTQIAPDAPVDERPPSPPAAESGPWWTAPPWTAVAAFAVGTLVALGLPRAAHFSGYDMRATALVLGFGAASLMAVGAIVLRRRATPDWLAGITAGLFGAWIVAILTTALRGTPFPFYGLSGDAGRVVAMATRYSVTWHSADAIIPGLPSEYPPLFPWVVGRTALLLDVPAWKLVGQFEALVTGLAILVGFLMWRRLVPAWTAVLVTVFTFLMYMYPVKPYEVVTLAVVVPWALASFARPPRGRLHWLAAGAVGGVLIMTYYGWILFGSLGLLAIVIATMRAEAKAGGHARRAYLLHVLKVMLTAAVVASPFLVPLGWAKVTIGGSTVADLYGGASFVANLFPFLEFTPVGVLQFIGVVGLAARLRTAWWAPPIATLIVGAYVYRAIGTFDFILTQHTLLAQYTGILYGAAMVSAGMLTLVDAVPALLAVLKVPESRRMLTVAVAAVLAWAGYSYAQDWMPGPSGTYSDWANRAFAEPQPDGSRASNDAASVAEAPWFPVGPIQTDVTRVLGPNPQAVTLSVDGRLFSFLPWPGYTWDDLGGSLGHTFERVNEVRKLGDTSDPTAFADASRHTAYGPIDIFVLKVHNGAWEWSAHMGYGQPDAVVSFRASQFDAAHWVVDDRLPNDYVVAVRRP
jgi:hypothetical protein